MDRTVGQVAEVTGVSVRTLHHYDEIGLLRPAGRTEAGYRLYGHADLERLQTILFYRELGFSLDRIQEALDDPGFDRGHALKHQRELLVARTERTRRLIDAIDDAITAHERGDTMSDAAMFEVFPEQREHQQEAQERWGDTDAWRQSTARAARSTKADWEQVKAEAEHISRRIADTYRSGAPPTSEEAMGAVEAHRRHISERFYDCPPQLQVGLGEMYVSDPRFRATYEDQAEGLAEWVRDAIVANAARHDAP